jgi:formate dehydrogenase major subunit
MHHLTKRVREKLAESGERRDRAILDLAWDYPTDGPNDDPSASAVLAEIGGFDAEGRNLPDYLPLAGDGSTRCGCWIYAGCYTDGVNQTARRKAGREQSWVAPEWAWAWPMNRRILYNRASADPEGRPWSERKRYVWWDEDAGRWTGEDVPDFTPDKRPDYVPPDDAAGPDAVRGDEPFIMQADGRAWLYAPNGLKDGPFPAHYEPPESPVDNALYGRRANPARQRLDHRENPDNRGDGRFPYVFTTYRLTEHHTAGQMSRTLPYLSELMPEFFCEVSPALAAERELEHGDWATIVTSRAAVEARVLVTDRILPLRVDGRVIHQVGLPYHWGWSGLATGDAANDLLPLALDSNVHISEFKSATCDVRPGRRPRGPGLLALVEEYRARARQS